MCILLLLLLSPMQHRNLTASDLTNSTHWPLEMCECVKMALVSYLQSNIIKSIEIKVI